MRPIPEHGTLQTSGSGDSAGDDLPSTAVLNDNITLLAGETYGMALVLDSGHGHEYTNGNGSNENYDNGEVALSLGSATNVPSLVHHSVQEYGTVPYIIP